MTLKNSFAHYSLPLGLGFLPPVLPAGLLGGGGGGGEGEGNLKVKLKINNFEKSAIFALTLQQMSRSFF